LLFFDPKKSRDQPEILLFFIKRQTKQSKEMETIEVNSVPAIVVTEHKHAKKIILKRKICNRNEVIRVQSERISKLKKQLRQQQSDCANTLHLQQKYYREKIKLLTQSHELNMNYQKGLSCVLMREFTKKLELEKNKLLSEADSFLNDSSINCV
jgi:hypothetical protein